MRATRGVTLAGLAAIVAAGLLVAAKPPAAAPAKGAGAAAKKDVQVLRITLSGEIAEHVGFSLPFGPTRSVLRDYTATVRKAATDPKIKALVLRLKTPAMGLAKVEELGAALGEFRAAKKKVYCYADVYTNVDYLIACHADTIGVAPGGGVATVGLGMEVAYLKGLLDWAGIKVDVFHCGAHKAAGEPFEKEKMSDENRKVLNEFLDDVYAQYVGMIAKGRGLAPDAVRKLIDGGPYSVGEAKKAGLVHQVAYFDKFLEAIGGELGGKVAQVKKYHRLGKKGRDLSQFNIFSLFASMQPKPDIPRTSRAKIVIVYASGMIMPGGDSNPFLGDIITAEKIAKSLEAVRKDDTVKAVVLRIDSPGGAAVTSDLIWREIHRTKEAGKKVVASLSSVAASGGYYMAMAADKIVAHPTTVTGSIGVVGVRPSLEGLYEKIGVNMETFYRGKNARLLGMSEPLEPEQRDRMQAFLNAIYDEFVAKAAQGRGMDPAKMRALATGRVWTARAAKTLGLVDELGGLKTAFDLAVKLAKLEGRDVQPVVLPREKDFFEMLLSKAAELEAATLPAGLARRMPGPLGRVVPDPRLLELLCRARALTLMPYRIEIR